MASIKTPTCFSSGVPYSGSFKADSHIECRAHAALLPFPCHAMPLRIFLSHLIYTVLLCLIHTYHAMPMPRPCHALTMPFFSRPRHGTAPPSREGLWDTCPRSASSGYHAGFHEYCYQKHTNPPQNDPYLRL